ncbi:hypothetical protein [Edaphobacter aggregans]|uniref:hypothetical protein n=1 Tax=Edaphobacter aggregans TaxID=570835 RepID=UPI0005512872|nr:hypothetical protein [Edaphobacter aggregans]
MSIASFARGFLEGFGPWSFSSYANQEPAPLFAETDELVPPHVEAQAETSTASVPARQKELFPDKVNYAALGLEQFISNERTRSLVIADLQARVNLSTERIRRSLMRSREDARLSRGLPFWFSAPIAKPLIIPASEVAASEVVVATNDSDLEAIRDSAKNLAKNIEAILSEKRHAAGGR